MALLESILQEGKKIIAAAGVAVTLACTTAVRAQRDYDLYPARKAEIALYNMQQIAGQICGPPKGLRGKAFPYCAQMSFSGQGLDYVEKDCLAVQYGQNMATCVTYQTQNYFIKWDEIRKIVPSSDTVRICSEIKGCVNIQRFLGLEQATDFAEAMNIYVMER